MEPAASRPSMVMQHNIRSTESHELPEASFWRSADTRHCRSAFVCLWRLCQVGICKSAGERENRTRELEEPVSGQPARVDVRPSRRLSHRPGGDQRENERTCRGRTCPDVCGLLWISSGQVRYPRVGLEGGLSINPARRVSGVICRQTKMATNS